MRKLTTREKVLLTVCLGAVIVFCYYRFFFKPIESQMDSLSTSVDDAQQQLMLLEKISSQMPEIQSDYTEKKSLIEEQKLQYVMDSYNQVTMIAQLQEMIDKNGATGKSVSFSEPEERLYLEENPELGYYTIEKMSLSFTTTENNWIKILDTFENAYGANKITSFSVNPIAAQTITDEEGNVTVFPSQVSVSMNVEVYADRVITEAVELVGEDQYNYQANGVFE